ncbi:hypothetical protein Ndes2526B_g08194 [Nannochloris sp. 'desiccata']|nr:hypothetical protein NADE_000929 [Chlorella desiccata (nom. nud.)]KAH7616661.1 hypothetical protein NADE_001470 [Chlorella desiccata (nom. nud.)]
MQRVVTTLSAMMSPFKMCFPTSTAMPSHCMASPPASPSQSQETQQRGDAFDGMAVEDLLQEIQALFQGFQHAQKLMAETKQVVEAQDRRKHEMETWAKEHVYQQQVIVTGLRQVILDAGLGHLLGDDVSVDEMECDPLVGTWAEPCDSGVVMAADAPLRDLPCETGMCRVYFVEEKPYNSPANSGSKRKRSEIEEEKEEGGGDDDHELDSCKRHKPSDDCSLEALLEYLEQCNIETLVCEAQTWSMKAEQKEAELDEVLERRDALWEENNHKHEALKAQFDRVNEEVARLAAILGDHSLIHLAFPTKSNESDESDRIKGGSSIYLGMQDTEAEIVEKEEKEEDVSSPAVIPNADSDLQQEENIDANSAENNENAAPFQKAVDLTQRMMAPFHNAQRVLKECNRRFQMRERSGETRW